MNPELVITESGVRRMVARSWKAWLASMLPFFVSMTTRRRKTEEGEEVEQKINNVAAGWQAIQLAFMGYIVYSINSFVGGPTENRAVNEIKDRLTALEHKVEGMDYQQRLFFDSVKTYQPSKR